MLLNARFVSICVLSASVAAMACSDGSDKQQAPTASFEIDSTVVPNAPSIAGIDGGADRQLSSIADEFGRQADFVEREVILVTENVSEVNDLLSRWEGEVLSDVPTGSGDERAYLVHIDPQNADPAVLLDVLEAEDADNRGQYRLSSNQGHLLMSAIASEWSTHGHGVSANWIFWGDEIAHRSTTEAPSLDGSGPTYTPDAFTWPYMSRGSVQDTGAAEAWRLLDAAGRTSNRVTLAILDGGFSSDVDYPGSPVILPAGAWDLANPHACSSGSMCPWHGSYVAAAAMAVPDNESMSAGPGGTVADGIFVQMPSPDFFAFLTFATETLPAALGHHPSIINISASANIPAGACLVGACLAMDLVGRALRNNNVVVVASAGNKSEDVDSEDCAPIFDICWEGAVVAPCEVDGVLCVGGLRWNSTRKDPGSNWGSDSGSTSSVDIYGPYGVWVGPDPDDDPAQNVVQLKTGTSFSSPFVAGIAAQVRAADPGLTAAEVVDVLLETAHTESDELVVHRRINAYGAVRRALGNNVPPYIEITQPLDESTHSIGGSVPLASTVDDDEGTPAVTWTSNRDGSIAIGSFTSVNTLSAGSHLLTATVDDGTWQVSDSVSIQLENDPPTVDILLPNEGDTFFESSAVALAGESFDPNNTPTFVLLDSQVSWRIDSGSVFATGHAASIPGGTLSPGSHTITFEGSDEESTVSDFVSITVEADPLNLPPTDVEIYDPDSSDPWPAVQNLGLVDQSDATGDYKSFALYGRATDPEFGNLTGTSLEWDISATNGTASPATATGTVQVVKLYVSPGQSLASFTVTLTAIDTDDSSITTSTSIVLNVTSII